MKTKNKQRYLLPAEYLGSVTAHPVVSESLRRSRPALVIIWGIPIAAYVWRSVAVRHWSCGFIGVAISAGFGYSLWHALVTGYTRNNHGEFLRASRPFGYWLSILFLALGYTVGVVALLSADYTPRS